jgi:hypothetical protein
MNYNVLIYDDAKIEIKEALNYYFNFSQQAGLHFYKEIERAIEILKLTPKFEIRYKDYRVLQIGNFPYLFHFIVNETNKIVEVYGLRSTYKNPKKNQI